ncbi:hypothetical protein SAMN02745181_0509 [Rubritalea squalenifaciens DSM 18772]|uniref:Uncharacterized protein n=1 Tax=Rubritalea squalenifaciens DSM 18772 TaxID=1123071 RepID=A0A1M6CL66_9BACT|nr:hypothetical protein SAMN02745181_0509 [Rubritalea squalenifaciens DSM 18772]
MALTFALENTMILKRMRLPILLLCTVALSSCGYQYETQEVRLSRGEMFKGRKLTKVTELGVHLARPPYGSTFFSSTGGRKHMNHSHSLGNNTHMRIISLFPDEQQALLEFSWLDSVGIFTMPAF